MIQHIIQEVKPAVFVRLMSQDHPSLRAAVEISQDCEAAAGQNSVYRQAVAVAPRADSGCISSDGERVQS